MQIFVTEKCGNCKYNYECNGLIINSLDRKPKLVCKDYIKKDNKVGVKEK